MKLGFGEMAKLATIASKGPEAIGAIVLDKLPNAARVLFIQRHAMIVAAIASTMAKGCGDALAQALGQGADVADLAGLERALMALRGAVGQLDAMPGATVSAGELTSAYGQRNAA